MEKTLNMQLSVSSLLDGRPRLLYEYSQDSYLKYYDKL